jgi:hypothetical protein
MKKNIHSEIYLSATHPADIKLYLSSGDDESSALGRASAFCLRYGYYGWKRNIYGLYLLRGRCRDKRGLLFGLLQVRVLPANLYPVLDLLKYYNESARKIYKASGSGEESYRDCLIRCLAADCRELIGPLDGFMTGNSESHIWIAERFGSDRIMIIHF